MTCRSRRSAGSFNDSACVRLQLIPPQPFGCARCLKPLGSPVVVPDAGGISTTPSIRLHSPFARELSHEVHPRRRARPAPRRRHTPRPGPRSRSARCSAAFRQRRDQRDHRRSEEQRAGGARFGLGEGEGAAVRSSPARSPAPTGAFRVQGLRPGAYAVRVTFLGFAPKMQDVAIAPDNADRRSRPACSSTRVAVTLGAVAVVEKQDAVTIEPDRNTYRAKDVAPAATNASEVLEATPSVRSTATARSACAATRTSRSRSTAVPRRSPARSSARTSRAFPPNIARSRRGHSQSVGQVRPRRDGRHHQHRS